MRFTITPDHFETEEEARAEIERLGWHALDLEVTTEEKHLHWHDFNTKVFVVEGEAAVEYEDGSRDGCAAGARIEAAARVVHRDVSPGYKGIFAFDVDPAQMTQPVDKPVDSLDR